MRDLATADAEATLPGDKILHGNNSEKQKE
jgi:hypothetical protein